MGIADVKWKITPRAPPTPPTTPKQTRRLSTPPIKRVPGHQPVNYAQITKGTPAPTDIHTKYTSDEGKEKNSDDMIQQLLQRTAKLEADVIKLTTALIQQQSIMEQQSEQLTILEEKSLDFR